MNIELAFRRDFSLDNIRFFLIFTVVFAHLLEVCSSFSGCYYIYQFIYTFHMPVFIFLFGYNVKYSPKRIVYRWCIPYVVFQSIYILFSRIVLKNYIVFQYTTPYWLLWYMLACIFYQLLLPLFETTDKCWQIITILCVYAISLFIGYEDSVGYYLSSSRFFVFQPYFLLGYYFKKSSILELLSVRNKTYFFTAFISAVIILLSVPFLFYVKLPSGLLYGSYSYSSCGSTLWMRAAVSLISFSWILFLFVVAKPYLNKKLPLLTRIGKNTWPVFLLHGFLVKAIPIYCHYLLSSPWRVLLLSCVILVIMGNKFFNRVIYYTCFSWGETLSSNTIEN